MNVGSILLFVVQWSSQRYIEHHYKSLHLAFPPESVGAGKHCTRCWQAIADSRTPASGRNVASMLHPAKDNGGEDWQFPVLHGASLPTLSSLHQLSESNSLK